MAIITISRGTFSGGKEIAEKVAKKLGYKCISREVLQSAAKDFHVPLDKLTKALNDKPGIFEKMGMEKRHYLFMIKDELVRAVKDEEVVYHGLAGHLLLEKVPNIIRVKVIASTEFRIKAAMQRDKLNREDAVKYIKNVDMERNKWVKAMYNVDRNDPALYDIVINLDRIKIDKAVENVVYLAERDRFKATAESRKRMDDLILAADIRANIASDGSVSDGKLDIDADGGVVTLAGKLDSLLEADKVKKIAVETKGVSNVVSRMKIIGNR